MWGGHNVTGTAFSHRTSVFSCLYFPSTLLTHLHLNDTKRSSRRRIGAVNKTLFFANVWDQVTKRTFPSLVRPQRVACKQAALPTTEVPHWCDRWQCRHAACVLQVLRSCLNTVLGSLYNIVEESHQQTATVLNNVVLVLGVLTVVVNSIISAFDMSEPKVPQCCDTQAMVGFVMCFVCA